MIIEKCRMGGTLDKIQKLIPVLKEFGYDDIHLYYEDSNIWVIEWHNSEHDGVRWELPDYEQNY